jgi:DNA-binding transcriptional ArsR family regulator
MAPPDDVLALTSPEQFAALAHPLRQRLLFALSAGAATISRLAARLEVAKGSVAHHLKVLRDAGLVAVVETRTVRGGTEQYYGRTAKRLLIDAPAPEGTAALFTAVAQEVNRSPDELLLTLRHLRLTPARAAELAEQLRRLVDECEEDEAADALPHGVLVTFYQQRTGSSV